MLRTRKMQWTSGPTDRPTTGWLLYTPPNFVFGGIMTAIWTSCGNILSSFCWILRYNYSTVKIIVTVTFQLYWWRKTLGALLWIISGTSGHLSGTTDILLASLIVSSWQDSNHLQWGASGLKLATINTWPQRPLVAMYENI
jgi:hypothetical protein